MNYSQHEEAIKRYHADCAKIEALKRFFLEELGIDIEIFLNKSHKREIARLRHPFCVLALQIGAASTNIAAFLNRDHSTIIQARKKTYAMCRIYKDEAAVLDETITKLNAYLQREKNRK